MSVFNELTKKMEEIFDNEDGFEWTDFALGDYDEDQADAANVKWIEQRGGGEGGAEDCFSVFQIGDTFYKVEYNYYSHHGYEFDYATAKVVNPVERTVTFYE